MWEYGFPHPDCILPSVQIWRILENVHTGFMFLISFSNKINFWSHGLSRIWQETQWHAHSAAVAAVLHSGLNSYHTIPNLFSIKSCVQITRYRKLPIQLAFPYPFHLARKIIEYSKFVSGHWQYFTDFRCTICQTSGDTKLKFQVWPPFLHAAFNSVIPMLKQDSPSRIVNMWEMLSEERVL